LDLSKHIEIKISKTFSCQNNIMVCEYFNIAQSNLNTVLECLAFRAQAGLKRGPKNKNKTYRAR